MVLWYLTVCRKWATTFGAGFRSKIFQLLRSIIYQKMNNKMGIKNLQSVFLFQFFSSTVLNLRLSYYPNHFFEDQQILFVWYTCTYKRNVQSTWGIIEGKCFRQSFFFENCNFVLLCFLLHFVGAQNWKSLTVSLLYKYAEIFDLWPVNIFVGFFFARI